MFCCIFVLWICSSTKQSDILFERYSYRITHLFSRFSWSMEWSQHAASGLQHTKGTGLYTTAGYFSYLIQINAVLQSDEKTNCASCVQCSSPSTGRTGQVFPVCSVESQESVQPFLLPEQQPGEFFLQFSSRCVLARTFKLLVWCQTSESPPTVIHVDDLSD